MDKIHDTIDYSGFNPESPRSKELFQPFVDILFAHEFEEAFDSSEDTKYNQSLSFTGESDYAVDGGLVDFGDSYGERTNIKFTVNSVAENTGLSLNLTTDQDGELQHVLIRSDRQGNLTANRIGSDTIKPISDEEVVDIFFRASDTDPLKKHLFIRSEEDTPTFKGVNNALSGYWERLAEQQEGTIITNRLLEVKLPEVFGDNSFGRLYYKKTEDPTKSKESLTVEFVDKYPDLDAETIRRLKIGMVMDREAQDTAETAKLVVSELPEETTIARMEQVDKLGRVTKIEADESTIHEFVKLLDYIVTTVKLGQL